MKIILFDTLSSTHQYLVEQIKANELKPPIAILAKRQTKGIGSKNQIWQGDEGNLFLSFCIKKSSLPKDLALNSISIYIAFIMKEFLKELGSKVFLKWPNDFYINEKKVGGCMSMIVKDNIIGSIGINLKNSSNEFAILDIGVEAQSLSEDYLKNLEKFPSWKNIFSIYKLEFHKSKNFFVNIDARALKLELATLCEDGSIMIENKKVYSLR